MPAIPPFPPAPPPDPAVLRFFSAGDVARAVSMADAIARVREAFVDLSAGRARVPPRTRIDVADRDGTVLYMPSHLPIRGVLAVKVVSTFQRNPAAGLPLIHALVVVNDAATGRPVAVMDGERLTALRTAAAGGLATELLAVPAASVCAVFGAGVQGRALLEAVCAVRPIRRSLVFDPDGARAAVFCREMRERLRIDVAPAESPAALREADVICTATTSAEPVFAHANVKPGAHINAIGAYKPTDREIPEDTVTAARRVADQREACLAEAGDIVIPLRKGLLPPDPIDAEIGEIAAGDKPGRRDAREITLFKSVGTAVQDAALAALVLERAGHLGLGVPLGL